MIGQGSISVARGSELAKAFMQDGATGVALKQLAHSGRQRDVYRWLQVPLPVYTAEVPLASSEGEDGTALISMILPSDVLCHLASCSDETFERSIAQGGRAAMKAFWELPFLRGHNQQIGLASSQFENTCPMVFHEDAVPALGDTATIWSWSSAIAPFGNPWDTRHALAVLPTARITDATRDAIVEIIAWDMRTLEQLVWPGQNHKGEFWQPKSKRAARAGLQLQMGGRFCFWKGDMEAHWKSHRAVRYYRCNNLCEWCMASKKSPEFDFASTTLAALWRETCGPDSSPDHSPWRAVRGCVKSNRLIDSLHVYHLGVLQDLIASCLVDTLERGELQQYFNCDAFDWDATLLQFTVCGKKWALERNLDMHVGKITLTRLGRSERSEIHMYPQLDTRIKAARCKAVLHYLAAVTHELANNSASEWAKVRALACWAFSTCLQLWSSACRDPPCCRSPTSPCGLGDLLLRATSGLQNMPFWTGAVYFA
ncbi:unnamed protein product [Effrenium voratum]|uniref:Uncharacterized protein n=1 Tax=Effrenium voratum TaxID=2562239 RepID=A0AA36MUC6_9DINO|nr:unnamed protein product [Effrenium voratum]